MSNGPSHHSRPALPINSTDHVLGPRFAAANVVEFGDYESRERRRVYPATQKLVGHFGNRIGFAYRYFPLNDAHPQAGLAAEVAEAAAAQDNFWGMHAKLFENPRHRDPQCLRAYAQDLELEMARYDAELGGHMYLQPVQEHMESGRRSGVSRSPTFYLTGLLQVVSPGLGPLIGHIEMALEGRPHS